MKKLLSILFTILLLLVVVGCSNTSKKTNKPITHKKSSTKKAENTNKLPNNKAIKSVPDTTDNINSKQNSTTTKQKVKESNPTTTYPASNSTSSNSTSSNSIPSTPVSNPIIPSTIINLNQSAKLYGLYVGNATLTVTSLEVSDKIGDNIAPQNYTLMKVNFSIDGPVGERFAIPLRFYAQDWTSEIGVSYPPNIPYGTQQYLTYDYPKNDSVIIKIKKGTIYYYFGVRQLNNTTLFTRIIFCPLNKSF